MVELVARVAELERRFAGTVRHGRVAEVDAAKGRVRLSLGESTAGGDFLSPWVPYAQFAGALRAHIPVSPGQQLTLMAPGGDWQQAVAVPLAFSDAVTSPSNKGDENVITYGNVTITLKDDLVDIRVGSAQLCITSASISLVASRIDLN